MKNSLVARIISDVERLESAIGRAIDFIEEFEDSSIGQQAKMEDSRTYHSTISQAKDLLLDVALENWEIEEDTP